jgi:hypothetical protein
MGVEDLGFEWILGKDFHHLVPTFVDLVSNRVGNLPSLAEYLSMADALTKTSSTTIHSTPPILRLLNELLSSIGFPSRE